ncbi:polysaccharide pyruvyl transferase family protein [Vibrio alginolyticus]|uniref:polysaccharide pyruvyl transferase family protein n=1 Tax=Vibrio sp. B1FLJ16 TaxID=2751178 RepID=UPI0015F46A4A|nr:polysaccharide pyruvyl transferase family protein [Vibrio sp. B1FLJ16]CAD7797699.1 Polysaccharide pyruvyl transferase [Vibrio sp. B1FLJ16]CAE6880727.1 Polysaccharide pyruvyl transferase [Vibrio sp. B1FLJ16]
MKRKMRSALGKIKRKAIWSLKVGEIKKRFSDTHTEGRIIYAITPPPKLSNLGDQAQVVAIYDWIEKNFPNKQVIELNKDEVLNCYQYVKPLINDDDVIVLHSGGNMGDRGMWSERSRRCMIKNFPKNKIVSLPQTINFHDTESGQRELSISKGIYNAHKDLTIIARDHQSFALANKYFDKCKTDEAPDFVLSYNTDHLNLGRKTNGKVLFCLREDSESALNDTETQSLLSSIQRPYDVFDTTISQHIRNEDRKSKLDETLNMFSEYDAIVTDRFHGLIFSVLCKKPTVVLPTVDHKLTSAFDWFDSVNFVKFADSIEDVPVAFENVLTSSDFSTVDWHKAYFDKVAEYID